MEPPRTTILNHVCLWLALMAMSALLASAMVIRPDFFEGMIAGKQWGLECAVCLAALCVMPMLVATRTFKFSMVDVAVVLLALWVIVSDGLIHQGHYQPVGDTFFNVSLWVLIYGFVRLAKQYQHFTTFTILIWLAVAVFISGWGLVQLYGLVPSQHALFRITGSFHNPGPFSGYVVAALPVALAALAGTTIPFHKLHPYRNKQVLGRTVRLPITLGGVGYLALKSIAVGLIIAVLLVVPAARSRAAWIAGLAGVAYVLWTYRTAAVYRGRLAQAWGRLSHPVRIAWVAVMALVLIGATYGLYAFKAGSADGRLLMWRITGTVIGQSPVTGHGAGAFAALYMPAQADWFRSGNGTAAQALVAGSPEAPFNELLKLWLGYGAVAVAMVGFILLLLFWGKTNESQPTPMAVAQNVTLRHGLKGALLTMVVFSLFSYPFDLAPHMLLLVMATALLAGSCHTVYISNNRVVTTVLKTSVVAGITALFVIFMPQRTAYYTALVTWQESAQIYNMRLYGDATELYATAFPVMANNGLYLQMYGKALGMYGQYEKSNEILAEAKQRYGSYIIYNTMGDNHKALGNAADAEKAYQTAAVMVPGMMLPKYLLAKLYHDTGQQVKAIETANKVLAMPVKVPSMATDEIINEMKKIIKQ